MNPEAEAEHSQKKYRAAKAVVKWLAPFTSAEQAQLLAWVASELKLAVPAPAANGAEKPATAGK